MKDKLKSRKFWIAVCGMAFAIAGALTGYLNSGEAVSLFGIVNVVYLAVQGVIDNTNAQ